MTSCDISAAKLKKPNDGGVADGGRGVADSGSDDESDFDAASLGRSGEKRRREEEQEQAAGEAVGEFFVIGPASQFSASPPAALSFLAGSSTPLNATG